MPDLWCSSGWGGFYCSASNADEENCDGTDHTDGTDPILTFNTGAGSDNGITGDTDHTDGADPILTLNTGAGSDNGNGFDVEGSKGESPSTHINLHVFPLIFTYTVVVYKIII